MYKSSGSVITPKKPIDFLSRLNEQVTVSIVYLSQMTAH